MKKILALAAFTLIATLYFTSCDPDSENYTPRERMEAFMEDANAGRFDDLKQHTHPEADDYNTANATFWETYILEEDIPLMNLNVSGQTATCTGAGSVTFDFYLTADGDNNNLINHIDRGGSTIFH